MGYTVIPMLQFIPWLAISPSSHADNKAGFPDSLGDFKRSLIEGPERDRFANPHINMGGFDDVLRHVHRRGCVVGGLVRWFCCIGP